MYQKWPDQIFPIVNFVFSHDGHFGLGRGEGGFGGGVPPPLVFNYSKEALGSPPPPRRTPPPETKKANPLGEKMTCRLETQKLGVNFRYRNFLLPVDRSLGVPSGGLSEAKGTVPQQCASE